MRPIKLKIVAFQFNVTVPLSGRRRVEKRKRKLISRVLILIGLLFAVTLMVKVFFGDRGFFGLLKIKSEYASILEEVNQLQNENVKLAEEINKLKDDKYYQEKIAREKMGFIREGEVVFLFTDDDEKDPFIQKGENIEKNKEGSREKEKEEEKEKK